MELIGQDELVKRTKIARTLLSGVLHEIDKDVCEIDDVQALLRGAVGDVVTALFTAKTGVTLDTGSQVSMLSRLEDALSTFVTEEYYNWKGGVSAQAR